MVNGILISKPKRVDKVLLVSFCLVLYQNYKVYFILRFYKHVYTGDFQNKQGLVIYDFVPFENFTKVNVISIVSIG